MPHHPRPALTGVRGYEGNTVAAAGGGELAKQLISVYLTLFQLIMSGKAGHAAAAHRAAEERTEAARVARCAPPLLPHVNATQLHSDIRSDHTTSKSDRWCLSHVWSQTMMMGRLVTASA